MYNNYMKLFMNSDSELHVTNVVKITHLRF